MLDDTKYQNTVISQSLQTAQTYGFSGIVVDFEYNALPFPSVFSNITALISNFAQQTHKDHLSYGEVLYGDIFYRLRPYDVASIGKQTDMIYILAYDLHKANGDPGPNFPMDDPNDYTFPQMVADFSGKLPLNKITLVFCMFGYDWQVDNSGKAMESATAVSNQDIQQEYVNTCHFASCTVQQTSEGVAVHYTDKQKQKHIVWFDDTDTLQMKKKFLLQNRIGNIGYWAYGYF